MLFPYQNMENTFIKLKFNPNPIMAKKISVSILVISLPLFYVSLLQTPLSTLFKDTTFWFLMSNSIIIFIVADTGLLFSPSYDMYADFVTSNNVKITCTSTDELPMESAKFLDESEKLIGDGTRKLNKDNDSAMCDKEDVTRETALVVKGKSIDDTISEEGGNEFSTLCIKQVQNKEICKDIVVKDKFIDDNLSPSNKEKVEKAEDMKTRARKRVVKGKSLDPNTFNENRSVGFHEKPLRRSVTKEKRCNSDQNMEYATLSDEELNRRVEDFIRRYYRETRLQLCNESV